MARAQRTAELLAAAGLVDLDIERERQKGLRNAASSQALASLLPSLIQTGAGIAGDVAAYDLKKQATEADREIGLADAKAKEADALDRIANRKAKSAADIAKAEAEKAKLAREATDKQRDASMGALRSAARAPGATTEMLIGRAMADEGLGELDDAGVAGILAEEQSKAAIDAKRAAPPAPKAGPSADALAEKAKRSRLLDLDIAARENELAGGPGSKRAIAAEKPKLTSGEATAAIELKGAQKLLDELGNLKKTGGKDGTPINTGPLEALVGFAAGKVGLQSPEWTKFKATAGTQLAEYIKSISGATVSEPERKELLNNVPTPSDDDEEFVAKLEAVKSILDTKLANMRAGYAATGRDTAIFDEAADDTDAAELSDEDLDAEIARLKGNR